MVQRTTRASKIKLVALIACALLALWGIGTAAGQGRVDPNLFKWTRIAGKFDSPLFMTHAGDGSGRLFVVEQAGFVWIVRRNTISEKPFLDISELLPDDVFRGGYTERGLLGMAFHPDYATNGLFFIYYISRENRSILARYKVSADNPDQADPASAAIVLTVEQPPHFDHKGGMLAFGPDGYLYIGLGDGGGTQGDPDGNAQNPRKLLGKILRLDVNAEMYTIPPDNPFADGRDGAPEVWVLGLRNPWRFSFDRATGDLYIGDVGWGNWEEINYVPAGSKGGLNFGWAIYEGTHRIKEGPDPADLVMPVTEYSHTSGDCSVTGGYVYRGLMLVRLRGTYLYADYCTGQVWMLTRNPANSEGAWQSESFGDTRFVISSFGEDERGELYIVDYKGWLYRLESR